MRISDPPTVILRAGESPFWGTGPADSSLHQQDPSAGGEPTAGGDSGPQGDSDPLPVTRESVNGETSGGDANTEQPDDQQQQGNPQGDCLTENLPLLIGFPLILYFLIIRPAQKQEKQRKQMQSSLGKGSKVVTTGGMHGTVAAIDEATVTLKVHGDQRLTFDRSAIGRILDGGSGDEASDPKGS